MSQGPCRWSKELKVVQLEEKGCDRLWQTGNQLRQSTNRPQGSIIAVSSLPSANHFPTLWLKLEIWASVSLSQFSFREGLFSGTLLLMSGIKALRGYHTCHVGTWRWPRTNPRSQQSAKKFNEVRQACLRRRGRIENDLLMIYNSYKREEEYHFFSLP